MQTLACIEKTKLTSRLYTTFETGVRRLIVIRTPDLLVIKLLQLLVFKQRRLTNNNNNNNNVIKLSAGENDLIKILARNCVPLTTA